MAHHLWLAILAALFGALAALPATAQSQKPEPEEPDFAFIAGGPYTQAKNSIQIIHQTAFGTRDFIVPGARRNEDEFLFFFRTEWGLTDRWELDVITPLEGNRERVNGAAVASNYGFADSIVGIRYRLVNEASSPFTLTMGPQLILPTGSVAKGTGLGSAGFAWDVSAAKDWGGPAFLYTSFNTSVLPSADDPTPGSTRTFALHGAEWATALGLRALERATASGKHDIHVFLEGLGSWEQEVAPGITSGVREGKLSWVAAPGVRYGFMTPKKTLIEIGVSVPFGLGPNGPKHGVVVQFQFENVFGQKTM
jgi:Putative MetA-pathway of phenol degradation